MFHRIEVLFRNQHVPSQILLPADDWRERKGLFLSESSSEMDKEPLSDFLQPFELPRWGQSFLFELWKLVVDALTIRF